MFPRARFFPGNLPHVCRHPWSLHLWRNPDFSPEKSVERGVLKWEPPCHHWFPFWNDEELRLHWGPAEETSMATQIWWLIPAERWPLEESGKMHSQIEAVTPSGGFHWPCRPVVGGSCRWWNLWDLGCSTVEMLKTAGNVHMRGTPFHLVVSKIIICPIQSVNQQPIPQSSDTQMSSAWSRQGRCWSWKKRAWQRATIISGHMTVGPQGFTRSYRVTKTLDKSRSQRWHFQDSLSTGWWFQTFFPISYMGCHPSHWRTHIFRRGRSTTNQSRLGGIKMMWHCYITAGEIMPNSFHFRSL